MHPAVRAEPQARFTQLSPRRVPVLGSVKPFARRFTVSATFRRGPLLARQEGRARMRSRGARAVAYRPRVSATEALRSLAPQLGGRTESVCDSLKLGRIGLGARRAVLPRLGAPQGCSRTPSQPPERRVGARYQCLDLEVARPQRAFARFRTPP